MQQPLQRKVNQLGLDRIERHIFLCCDQTKPKCCDIIAGLEAWDFLKMRLAELKLSERGRVYRSKVDCFRVCQQGPIAVVYPDNIWYHSCNPAVLEKIIQEHLLNGVPVEDYILARKKVPLALDELG